MRLAPFRRIRMQSSSLPAIVLLVCCATDVGAEAAPFAYVSNEGSASISIIDTATDKVVSTMKIGQKPRGIAISPDGKRLYISDQTANALRVIDTGKNAEITQVTLGESPEAIYVSADGKWLSAAIEEDNQVLIV